MWSLRRPVTAVALVATLALAGCGGGADDPTLRTTAVEVPGTSAVALDRAHVAIPTAWVEDPAIAARIKSGSPAGVQARTFVLRDEKAAPEVVAIVLIAHEPGFGKVAVENTDQLAKNFKSGFDSTSGLTTSQSKVGPKTDLGGQPAGTLLTDQAAGASPIAARGVVTGLDDQTYGVAAFGKSDHQPQVDQIVESMRTSWSWR